MELSSSRSDKDAPVSTLPTDLAVLLVGVAARQAASPTARNQARLARSDGKEETLFTPGDGAFNGPVATTLGRAKD